MTGREVDGDFTACDTALLNQFFRDYHEARTRGRHEHQATAPGPLDEASGRRRTAIYLDDFGFRLQVLP